MLEFIPNIATFFGYAGVLANMTWPLMKTRTNLLSWQVVACVLMLSHFALIGAYTGALIMLVAGIQAAFAIPLGKSVRFKYVYLMSLALTPVVCAFAWQGPQSIFSSLALAIVCIANFQLNPLKQRAMLICAIFAWVVHNVMVGSVPGLVSNGLAFCVSLFMLIKVFRRSSSPA